MNLLRRYKRTWFVIFIGVTFFCLHRVFEFTWSWYFDSRPGPMALPQTMQILNASVGYPGRDIALDTISNFTAGRKIVPNDAFSNFTTELRNVFNSDDMTSSVWEHDYSVPFILRGRRIFCRRKHIELLKNPTENLTLLRPMPAFEMIQAGLNRSSHIISGDRDIPVVLLQGDDNGCRNRDQVDKIGFPRLAWSIPSPKHRKYGNVDWCKAISIPAYSSWRNHEKHVSASSWEPTFEHHSHKYPWANKINKAVWRGSTTGSTRTQNLSSTPRGKLVSKGMVFPQLIDAAFTKAVGHYKSQENELLNQTRFEKWMRFNDQMRYKAVIDIDGFSWSSRFPMLLCLNSVVIKFEPDWVEYFFEDLEPMVHYVPASIDNVTEVAVYVLDEKNEDEMKNIVHNANTWCGKTITEERMAKDAMSQLEKYHVAFQAFMGEHSFDTTAMGISDDLIECV